LLEGTDLLEKDATPKYKGLCITTRRATVRDLDRLHRIEVECFPEEAFTRLQLEYILTFPNFMSLIAEIDGEVAGFIIGSLEVYNDKVVGHIYSIDVLEKFRRRGVASKLLNEMEKLLVERGAEECYLEVRVDNLAARSLYKKHGYKQIEILKDYYREGIHGIRLKKQLKSNSQNRKVE